MKRTVIKEEQYRGYLIRPVLSGFKIYRKGYYIGEYSSKTVAKALIDEVISKRKNLTGSESSETSRHDTSHNDQLSLF